MNILKKRGFWIKADKPLMNMEIRNTLLALNRKQK